MRETILTGVTWFLALGTGLVAGLFFAFSTFVMTAFGRIPAASGIAAMQAINVTILSSLFMPLFIGTTLASLALAVWALFGSASNPALLIAAGIIYVAGMFGCTALFNVPLNDTLAAVNPLGPNAPSVWQNYLTDWTFWNHVRTVASTLACALYIAALAVQRD